MVVLKMAASLDEVSMATMVGCQSCFEKCEENETLQVAKKGGFEVCS